MIERVNDDQHSASLIASPEITLIDLTHPNTIFHPTFVSQSTTMSDQYQTPPKPSSIDASKPLSEFAVKLDIESIKDLDIEGLLAFQRAANYLAAAQIFLQSNTLLQNKLTQDDVKPRLLGHWGTCAGLTLVYAHSSYLITRHSQKGDDLQVLFVTGPGHGAPSLLSTLFIEVRFHSRHSHFRKLLTSK